MNKAETEIDMALGNTELRIINTLTEMYGWPDGAFWLMSPNDLLGGERPDALIVAGRGEDVYACLIRLARQVGTSKR